jgi:hypothetical protein
MTDAIQNVFISSTMADLEAYRREVKDSLELIPASAFLSEDWVCTHGSTETVCKEKFDNSDAYLGIFAHWYGSVPPGKPCSITELEYAWAQKRWEGEGPARIAIFFPEPTSQANGKLIDKASALLNEAFPDNATEQENYRQRQKDFCKRVASQWKIVNHFSSQEDLAKKALVVHGQWMQRLIVSAHTASAVEKGRFATSIELGRLGRLQHIDCAKKLARSALRRSNPPAIAFLASGEEDAGLGQFIDALLTEPPFKQKRPAIIARPHLSEYNVEMFLSSVCKDAGLLTSAGMAATDPEAFARLVYERLRNQPLVVVLDGVQSVSGGAEGLHAAFWQHFHTLLGSLHQQQACCNGFIMLLVDYADTRPGACMASANGEELDCRKFIGLPPFTDFTQNDILNWLEDLSVPDDAPSHEDWARYALQKPSGEKDATPGRVFTRLLKRPLWPEQEEEW